MRSSARTDSSSRRRTRSALILADTGGILLAMAMAGSWSAVGWLYAGATFVSLAVSGRYRPRICLQALPEIPAMLSRLGVAVLLVMPLTIAGPERIASVQILATAITLSLARAFAYATIRFLRQKGHLKEITVIVGTGAVARDLARLMGEHPELGLEPIGFVDDATESPGLPLPNLGPITRLEVVLRRFNVGRVVVAFGKVREAEWVSILRTAVVNDVEIHIVPRFFDVGMAPIGLGIDQIWGIPIYRVRRSVLHSAAWRVKRIVDVICASLLLLLSAPLQGVLAIAVRLSSPGPVLFRQRRIGQNGREFELLKFRSMSMHHDGVKSWAATGEHQTAVGRWLRRTSLDELPQLWNVLCGDMSLVGPRPERPHFVTQFSAVIPGYSDRHRLPVGLSGWAQIHGLRGDESSLVDRARFDNSYIEGWSLWLDIIILLRTIGAVTKMAVGAPARSCSVTEYVSPTAAVVPPIEATAPRSDVSVPGEQADHEESRSQARSATELLGRDSLEAKRVSRRIVQFLRNEQQYECR